MDDQLIRKEILNQLTLGQWELAKSLILVYWKHSADENDAREWVARVLLNVCDKPEQYCVGSLNLPSKYHLSWLALQLIEELKIENLELAYLKKASEFKFYIYKASKICKEIPYENLASAFEAQHSTESAHCEDFLLSTNIENFFYELKNKEPFLAFYTLKSLLDENNFHIFSEDLTFNWIRKKCQLIKSNVSTSGVDEHSVALGEQILSELRIFVFVLSESKIIPKLPEDIICDLLSFSDHNIISKKNVYEALLGNSESADAFCEVEDRLLGRDESEKDIDSAENFFQTIFLSDGSINTKELFLRSMRRKEHFLEIILNNLLILVKSNKYADVHSYLNHRLTNCLRPLLVLQSWDVIQTNKDAKKVLDCLWPDSLDKKHFEPTYVQACDKLVRNVNFAEWCLEQREKNSEVATSEETSFSHLCLSLKSHSVVYVLKQYLQLSKLNINAVEDILHTFMSPKKDVTKEKSVRFAFETANDDWEDKVQKSVDCKILQSYCIMSAAMEAVQFSAEFEGWCRNKKVRKNRLTESVTPDDEKWTLMYREKVINNLEEVEQLLPSLYPLVHRLEILENLFTLIFATQEDVRADINTDSGQSSEYEVDNRDIAHSEDDGDMMKINGETDDDAKAKKVGQCLSDGMSVLSNCSGNSCTSYNYKRQGFLCNDTVIRSLLSFIKDNLLDICLKFEKRNAVSNLVFWNDDGKHNDIREKKFTQRIAELKKYVSEAIWRFEIISENESEKRNRVRITPCPVYLKIEEGKLSQINDNARRNSSPKVMESYPSMFSAVSKSRKRNRAHLNSTQFHGCSNMLCCHETVNKMLSSKESLLNMCLQQMDSIKAQQVIKVFAMEETDSAAEIIFAQKYVQLVKQYETTKIRAAPLIPATPFVPSSLSESLCHIASTAAAGMTATTDITTVDGFLSCCVLPSTSKIEECMKISFNPFCLELAECRDLKALVLCDLAFTSSQSLDSSASLLHAAIKRLNSIDEKGQFQSRMSGLYNFASRMIALVSEVSSRQNSHNLFTQGVFPKQTNLCSILAQGSISLKAENYSSDTDNWNTLLENLTLFYNLKEKYANQNSDVKKFDNQVVTDLHNAFTKLVQDGSIQLKQRLASDVTSMECQYPNYLKTIYVYMRQLATLKAHQNPEQKDLTSHCDFLNVLDQGLTSTLIDMVKEKDANIEWIEKFTMQFGLDFKHIITQACVGTVSAVGYKPIEYGNIVTNKYGQIILNRVLHEKCQQNPSSVVNDLLVNIIYFIKENCDIEDGIVTFKQLQQHEAKVQALLDDTNKLSAIDLGLLKTHDECCAFLINVSNLLSFHATMLRTCNEEYVYFGRSRLLNESCQVAYYVGQFGVISLFELHCLLGYSNDLKIPDSVLELRKLGNVNSFNFPHPKVPFLISRFFMTSPKLRVISAENLNSDLSCAAAEYLKAHVVLKNSDKEICVPEYLTVFLVACNDKQSLLALINTHCALDQSRNSEFQIVNRPTNYVPAVVLSYPTKGFESFEVEPLPEKIVVAVNEIPKHIRDYLREKCWLVDYLIDVLGGEINNDERMVFLNRLLDEFEGISPIEILVPTVHQVNFWIEMENKFIPNHNLENLLNFIDVSSSVRVEMKKCITPLRDFILCYLLNENRDANLSFGIKNCYLKAYIVLAMYRNWDYNSCMNYILHVATDRDIKGELREKLILLYERMSTYGQIIKVLSSVDFCWQDIENKSLNNPEEILNTLTVHQYYSLAIEWARLHSLTEELKKRVQHFNLILHLDKEEPDLVQAIIVLEKMTDRSSAVEMCEEALSSLENLKSQVFVIEYLVNDLAEYLTEAKKEELHLRHMGIKIMYCLPQTDSKYFAEILSSPALVVEQLIMNTKIELLGKSLEVIKTDILALNPNLPASAESIKCLLKTYAKKSLEVQIIQPKLSPASTFEQLTKSRSKNSESFNIPLFPPKKEDWVPDEQHTHCQVCREEAFNMFNRRHHCRRCGRVVCANCSRHRNHVQGYEDVKVRVCDTCKDFDSIPSHSPSSGFGMSGDRKPKCGSIREQDGSSASSTENARTDEPYQWFLKLNEDHNATVRDEFNFEQTPNVSLCISLLDCFLREEEAATTVLDLCEILFVVLQPSKDSDLPNLEVNYNVIVSVIESLIMSAKVKFANLSNHAGMGKCDLCLHNLNLVKLLITSNCYHLVPSRGINGHEDILKLRNQLVIEERWSLALEVTTKNGLDAFRVWARWGLALLEACDFANAREKFALCLEKKSDKRHLSSTCNDVLTDVIKQLELNLYKKDDEMITIKNCLTSLKAIRKHGGQAFLSPKRIGANMNENILDECLFYLQTYGSNSSLISFLIRHQKIDLALKFIREKEYDSELFKSLFMPCLHLKLLSQLEKELLKIDSTLSCWRHCIVFVCKYLDRLKYYNTLHQLQTFCKDYIRAATTCMKLFSDNATDYNTLFERLHILETASGHLQAAIQEKQNRPRSLPHQPKWKGYHVNSQSTSGFSIQQDFPMANIQRLYDNIQFQMEITKFFKENKVDTSKLIREIRETLADSSHKENGVPVVFAKTMAKTELSAMLFLANDRLEIGFEMASNFIEKCHLENLSAYTLIGKVLIQKRRYEDARQLITFMGNKNISSEKIDEMIWSCLVVLVLHPNEHTEADKFIMRLTSAQHKINAFKLCGRLRHGYLEAIKTADATAVCGIATAAESMGNQQVLNLCTRWLEQNKN